MSNNREKELETIVEQLKKEKDDLYADLESLCLKTQPDLWCKSLVLANRISVSEKERIRLTQNIKDLTKEKEELEKELHDLKLSGNKKNEDNSKIKNHKSSLEKILISEEEVENWKGMKVKYEKRLESMDHQLKQEMNSREQLEKELKIKEEKLTELKELLSQQQCEITIEDVKDSNSEIMELREKIKQLEINIKELHEDLQASYNDLEEKEVINESQNKEIEILKAEIHELKKADGKKMKELKMKNESLTRELNDTVSVKAAAKAHILELRANLDNEKAKYERIIAKMKSEFDVNIREMNKRVNKAEDLLKKQSKDIMLARKEKKDILEKITDKNIVAYLNGGKQLRTKSIDKGTSEEIENIKKNHQTQIEELRAQMNAMSTELATCKNKVKEAEKIKTDAILKASGYKTICASLTNELQQCGAKIPEITFKNINAFKSMSRMSPIQSSYVQTLDPLINYNNTNTNTNIKRQGYGLTMAIATASSSVGKRRHSAGNMLSWEQENIVKELFQKQMPMTPPASFHTDGNFMITQQKHQQHSYCDLNESNNVNNPFTNLLVFHALAKTGIHQLISSPPSTEIKH